MLSELRSNNYHFIINNPNKWSANWSQFPGWPGAFDFELKMIPRLDDYHRWMQNKWYYSIWISFIYIIAIFLLKKFMAKRSPLNLRLPLTLWSATLAVFSILGTIRCLPEYIDILIKRGWVSSFCDNSYYSDARIWTWSLLFTWSKVIELGDTVFVVLRKQKLHHLHWIHHVVTLIGTWYVIGDVPATARSAGCLNFLVHSVMYSYYSLKAIKIAIPSVVRIMITASQVVQMMVGFYASAKVLQLKTLGVACDVSNSVAVVGASIYALFFVLFAEYFIKSYFFKTYSVQLDVTITNKAFKFDENNNNDKNA